MEKLHQIALQGKKIEIVKNYLTEDGDNKRAKYYTLCDSFCIHDVIFYRDATKRVERISKKETDELKRKGHAIFVDELSTKVIFTDFRQFINSARRSCVTLLKNIGFHDFIAMPIDEDLIIYLVRLV